MSLRIVLDGRRIADFGIGTYIRNLVRSLASLDRSNHYSLITPAPAVPEFADLPSNFEIAVYDKKRTPGFAQFGFTMFLRRFPADLYHVPLNAVPLWMPKPYLVTIHDMSTLLFSNQKGYRSNLRLFYLRRGLARADRVLAVSSATRRDVETVLQIPSDRIQIVYNAPDPTFRQSSAAAATEIQRVLDRYRIHYPFLLYVGRTNPQKNIPRLVEAFAVLHGELREHPRYRDLRLM
jgi:glycosyltransferase involved in cell wall biosynthesis